MLVLLLYICMYNRCLRTHVCLQCPSLPTAGVDQKCEPRCSIEHTKKRISPHSAGFLRVPLAAVWRLQSFGGKRRHNIDRHFDGSAFQSAIVKVGPPFWRSDRRFGGRPPEWRFDRQNGGSTVILASAARTNVDLAVRKKKTLDPEGPGPPSPRGAPPGAVLGRRRRCPEDQKPPRWRFGLHSGGSFPPLWGFFSSRMEVRPPEWRSLILWEPP